MFIKPSFPDIGNKTTILEVQGEKRAGGATHFKAPDIVGDRF